MNLFDKYLKEGYNYIVDAAELSRSTKEMTLKIRSNFVLPFYAMDAVGNRPTARNSRTDHSFLSRRDHAV